MQRSFLKPIRFGRGNKRLRVRWQVQAPAATPLNEAGKPMFLNHWATCPTKDVHRKKGEA
jgi:hypothetical protein